VARYAEDQAHTFAARNYPQGFRYRDWVVRALNADMPFDEFARVQIAGDQLEQSPTDQFDRRLALGFFALGPVYYNDAGCAFKASLDELDDRIDTLGRGFLGLTLACARCHDHKFDPISQKDYYAFQSLVAGVEYEDRDMRTPEALAQQKLVQSLKQDVERIDQELARFEPVASLANEPRRVPDSKLNHEQFKPVLAKFVKMTIHDANLHPTLGLIEPCIDEFEIFAEGDPNTNLALAGRGVKVSAAGSRESDRHKLAFINDGKYGNSHSWMAGEAGRGSVLFELPQAVKISDIKWSRDRDGVLNDRTPTSYTIEAGLKLDQLQTVVAIAPPRPQIIARMNSDRFEPVKTRKVRFSIHATNNLEPCIDEIEIFNSQGRNVALASAGTKLQSSGDNVTPNRHELRQINDGAYGNSRSWMSSEFGKGWVVLEFPKDEIVERVVWGRDRNGEFVDRLATEYSIEVSDPMGQWRTVATSRDRAKYNPANNRRPVVALSTAGLKPDEARRANELMQKRKALDQQIKAAANAQKAFAGVFRKPDQIQLLYRGDPEQPKGEVEPAVLQVAGHVKLAKTASDAERRKALADWVTSPENPLTARVMVNRIWQGHFGVGLVDTPSDFGNSGGKPTHPELLDWLADEFIKNGWSLKKLNRQIVLSAAFRQSSRADARALEKDPLNELFSRQNRRRLAAEELRDGLLQISGDLNSGHRGGPGVAAPLPPEVLQRLKTAWRPTTDQKAYQARTIYMLVDRNLVLPVLEEFDRPDTMTSCSRRNQSTHALQSLALLNHPWANQVAEKLGREAMQQNATDDQARLAWLYQKITSRTPTAEIRKKLAQALDRSRTVIASETNLPEPHQAWADMALVLINSNAWLYVD